MLFRSLPTTEDCPMADAASKGIGSGRAITLPTTDDCPVAEEPKTGATKSAQLTPESKGIGSGRTIKCPALNAGAWQITDAPRWAGESGFRMNWVCVIADRALIPQRNGVGTSIIWAMPMVSDPIPRPSLHTSILVLNSWVSLAGHTDCKILRISLKDVARGAL